VTVYSLVPRFDNAVALRGNVAQPGRFPWRQGMRVAWTSFRTRKRSFSRDYWQARNQVVGIDSGIVRLLNQQQEQACRGRWRWRSHSGGFEIGHRRTCS